MFVIQLKHEQLSICFFVTFTFFNLHIVVKIPQVCCSPYEFYLYTQKPDLDCSEYFFTGTKNNNFVVCENTVDVTSLPPVHLVVDAKLAILCAFLFYVQTRLTK